MNTTPQAVTTFSLYQIITNRIVELLEQGVIPWRKPWSTAGPPVNAVSKHPYSGINLWLLLSLNYESNLYLTFEQVRKLGGTVNRGEKGHLVTFWMLWDRGKKEGGEASDDKIPFLRYYRVFNMDQCSGLPVSLQEVQQEKEVYPVAACEAVVQSMPNAPSIRFDKTKPFYHPKLDYINMPPMKRFTGSEAYYSTLFHEMVHSTGHESRLGRKSLMEMSEFGSETYSFEELVAELGSCYLCSHSGIGQKELKNSAAYIQAWLAKLRSNYTYIVLASSQAQRAANYILGKEGDCPVLERLSENRA